MAVLPAEIPTGLITGQYYFVNEDNIDVDTKPELTVVTGTVTFTSSVKTLRMPSKKAVLVPLAFDAVFDSQGNLTPFNGTGVGIELPATNSPLLTEQNYTWKVEFNLKEVETGFTVNLDSFDIQVPVGSTQDLSVLMPVDSSPGTITIQGGPQGDKGDQGDIGPTPNIEVGTVVTGAPNVIAGPQGDKGVKGDPGGFTTPTLLASSDLNTITTPGLYNQNTTGLATLATNYPRANMTGVLLVTNWASGGAVVQQYTTAGNGTPSGEVTYARTNRTGGWTPWRAFTSTRTDQTAGRAIYQWDDLNNREQLVYGDTGLRNIASLITPAYKTKVAHLRRVGSQVTISGTFILSAEQTTWNGDFLNLPMGFSPQNAAWIHTPIRTIASGTILFLYRKHRTLGFDGSTAQVEDSQIRFELSFPTLDPWPATLPGGADGAIPNL